MTAHTHTEPVQGCYRCETSADEAVVTTTNPREVLRRADEARRLASQAKEAVNLLRPGVGLGLSIGRFQVSYPEVEAVVTRALAEAAEQWEKQASEIEATVTVVTR